MGPLRKRSPPAAHDGPVTNRLAASPSPYLQQHAENPVDWWPWSDEAFAEAQRRDVDEPALRQRKGRPGRAARRRRGLHAGHHRAHGTGWLANDVPADAGRCPVLRRHILPAGAVLTTAGGRERNVARAPGRRASRRRSDSGSVVTGAKRHAGRTARPDTSRPRRRRLGDRVRRISRRIRWCAQVPAVNGSRVLAPSSRADGRTELPVNGRYYLRGDGARGNLRPTGWRLRPLQRRRRVGGAARREDAL